MADRTTSSTYIRTVQGDRNVIYVDVPAGGDTSDTIVARHLNSINFAAGGFRTSAAAASSVAPAVTWEGTTVQIFRNTATTGTAYTIKVEGK